MKTMALTLACLIITSGIAISAPRSVPADPAIAAIVAAVPEGTDIRKTSTGYKVITPSGPRTVYKTATGYRITGNANTPNLDIIKTSTGYKIENNDVRGRALGAH